MKKLLLALLLGTPAHAYECPGTADNRCPWIAMHPYGPIPDCTCMPMVLVTPLPPVNPYNFNNPNPSRLQVIINPYARKN
jgi:hypothetical protein